jgi:hypothetical protein
VMKPVVAGTHWSCGPTTSPPSACALAVKVPLSSTATAADRLVPSLRLRLVRTGAVALLPVQGQALLCAQHEEAVPQALSLSLPSGCIPSLHRQGGTVY